ncbi:MAG TPA: hypothetical protein EYH43_05245 [Persephonella sp.]|nr:hypothetical protein [Hydrogenothermaceae bacterium]HIQ25368.1 hypothetical protein [Persephonella sp.]
MLIALLTDFGYKDGFVGTVKGVIKSINPSIDIIDISHEISSFNTIEGALILKASFKYFPPGTIFTVVVDPGVGTDRKPIIVKTANYFFVAPDNGILSPILEEEKPEKIILIQNNQFILKADNNTFHGRDIFAPVSAYLSKGIDINKFGNELDNYTKLEFPKPRKHKNKIEGQILFFDKFGNGITNIKNIKNFKEGYVKNIPIKKLINAFLAGEKESLNLIKGSFGFYEIIVPLSNAKEKFNLKEGDKVVIYEA